jgi:ATP/maltotriose-dependent transcriptional regulator MalT
MMLPYTFEGAVDLDGPFEVETTHKKTPSTAKRATSELPFIFAKVNIPECSDLIERPRISDFLERSAEQFRATMVSGRAATGKTYAAVDLAKRYEHVAWVSIDSSDVDWHVFANYLTAAIAPRTPFVGDENNAGDIAVYLNALFAEASSRSGSDLLIVLDDIQHVFDAAWFPTFFDLLLS